MFIMYAYFESKSVEIKFKEDSEYQIILYTTSNQTFDVYISLMKPNCSSYPFLFLFLSDFL